MATPQELIALAASDIGITGVNNKFNAWYWGIECHDPNTYPWCAAAQSYWADKVGGLGYNPSASVSGVFNQLQRIPDEDVRPGDYVCYNWDGRRDTGWMDHIGLVEWFDHDSQYFGTIEGNTTDAYGGAVARCTRYNQGSYFTVFCRPAYDGQNSGSQPDGPAENSDLPMPRYRFRNREYGWCDWMEGLVDTGGSGDDFAGYAGCWNYDFQCENLGPGGRYKIVRADGSETINCSGNTDSHIVGLEIYYDTPNPGVTGYYKAKYRAHWLGVSPDWGKWEFDDEDGGAGKDADSPLDMIQITLSKA